MKKVLYVALPVVAFLLILTNAFFGHELFAQPTEQVSNKYMTYVHLQPDWESDNKNIIFEVTNSWYKTKEDNANHVFNAKDIQYNENQLRYVNEKSYVELRHGFSDCQEDWQPMLYRQAVDTVRHEIEYMKGSQLSDDPSVSVYLNKDNPTYDLTSQQKKIKNGFAYFIPLCTIKENTSYDYSIRTDNPSIGFDVYFVKSNQEVFDFYDVDQSFDYYDGNSDCFAQNKQSYSGSCDDVSKNSGLVVVIPDELNPWVTKFNVNLYENDDAK